MGEKFPTPPEKTEKSKIEESSSLADSLTKAIKDLPVKGKSYADYLKQMEKNGQRPLTTDEYLEARKNGTPIFYPAQFSNEDHLGFRASVKVDIDKPPVTTASEEENLARLKNALKNKPGKEWMKDAFKEPGALKKEHDTAWHESYNRYLQIMAELIEEESLTITPIDHLKLTREWLNINKDIKTFDQLQEKPSLRNLEDMTPEEIDARVAELEKFKKGFEIKV